MDGSRSYEVHIGLLVGTLTLALAACGGGSDGNGGRDTARTMTFVGGAGDWSDPANWDPPQVPGADDDVLIGGAAEVTMDPATAEGAFAMRDLTVSDTASLSTAPGTVMSFRDAFLDTTGFVEFRGTGLSGRLFDPVGGMMLNPSWLHAETVEFKGGMAAPKDHFRYAYIPGFTGGVVIAGIGGAQAAAPDRVGAGYYAQIVTDTLILENTALWLDLFYDFEPQPGERYTIVDLASERRGAFRGLKEGAQVARFDDIGLFLTYAGGDGNDIVIEARDVGPTAGETATFIADEGDWFDAANWDTGRVPTADDDVILQGNAQVTIDPAPAGAGKAIQPARAAARRLVCQNNASLRTLPGVLLEVEEFRANSTGELVLRDSGLSAQLYDPLSGFKLNPSWLHADIVEVNDSLVTIGLGGTAPAAPDAVGEGYFGQIVTNTLDISGATLQVELFYGFSPRAGQQFVIVELGETRIGEFVNAAEGAEVARFGDVALALTYAGGDGNDIVLAAVAP